jgi:hypothetical protein
VSVDYGVPFFPFPFIPIPIRVLGILPESVKNPGVADAGAFRGSYPKFHCEI